MMNKDELWQALLAQVQFNISKANFATWFKNTGVYSKKDGEVVVSVPNNFSKEWLENKYNKLVFKILHNLDDEIKEVRYAVAPKIELKPGGFAVTPAENTYNETPQLDFQELKINKDTNLNPRYTFENFIVGPFNELPQAAAWAVAQNPGFVYNPLFIYGGVGLGKTHLLQSVGNEVLRRNSLKKVKYVSSEKFATGIINSIRNRDVDKFKSTYKDIDVLIIDDIQFLSGKEKTQEEFFHIFNSLYEKNKQIIISSDRPPKAISALEERLRSRFEGGMIADISLPDFETRTAILKTKLQEKKASFSDEVLEYVAANIQSNIRELEGALNRLIAYQKLNNQSPSVAVAETLLKNVILSPRKVTNPEKIIQAVSVFYNLKESDILTASRKKEIVKPRQVAMFFLRQELKSSFPFIGRIFGGKDHTTAIHAFNKISKEIQLSENLNEEISLIKEQIYRS